MKMTKEHYNTLRALIAELLEQYPDTPMHYRNGNFPRAHAVKNLNVRFRWDLFFASTNTSFRSALYDYLNDAHIDTALRRIVKPIERNY